MVNSAFASLQYEFVVMGQGNYFGFGLVLPALGIRCTFSRAWHPLHIFPRLASVAHFPALGTRCTFSRAWHPLHIFPRLAPVAHFPALSTRCKFRQLHVFASRSDWFTALFASVVIGPLMISIDLYYISQLVRAV